MIAKGWREYFIDVSLYIAFGSTFHCSHMWILLNVMNVFVFYSKRVCKPSIARFYYKCLKGYCKDGILPDS